MAALLLTVNLSLTFLAVELGKTISLSRTGEATVNGADKVITQGTSLRHFKVADMPLLSFDYLEQVEKITVLYDRKVHMFNVASFEWLSSRAINVHFTTDQYILTVNREGNEAEVFITETLANGTRMQHNVWSTSTTSIDMTGTFADFYSQYSAHVTAKSPPECASQFNEVCVHMAAVTVMPCATVHVLIPLPHLTQIGELRNGVLTANPNPRISRMCFEAFSLSDPANRAGEIEIRIATQEHGLTEWEMSNIGAIWEADARKMGFGPILDASSGNSDSAPITDPFKFFEEDQQSLINGLAASNVLWPGAVV